MKIVLLIVLLQIFALTQGFSYSAVTFDEKQRVSALQFWTPEMMKKATPMERFIKTDKLKKYFKEPSVKDTIKADTDFVKPESLYQKAPYKRTGKVYFLFGGRPASCSGSSSPQRVAHSNRKRANSGRSSSARWPCCSAACWRRCDRSR